MPNLYTCVLIWACWILVVQSREQGEKVRVAVCITGQLARLELASKVRHFIGANIGKGYVFDVFATLSRDYNRRVNAFYPTTSSPHFKENGSFTDIGLFDELTPLRLDNALEGVHYHRALAFHRNVSFGFHYELVHQRTNYTVHEGLAHLGDKFTNDIDAQMARERLHMTQWYGLKRCMALVESYEKSSLFGDNRFNMVAKFRDDSVVMWPFHLPTSFLGNHPNFILTLNCMNSKKRGIHDNFYIISRSKAPCFLNSFVDYYYKNADALMEARLQNPEMFVAFYAQYCKLHPISVSLCTAPVLSMDFMALEGTVDKMTKKRKAGPMPPNDRPSDPLSHDDHMWIRGGTFKKHQVLLPCLRCGDSRQRSCFSKAVGAPGQRECPEHHEYIDRRLARQKETMKAFNFSTLTRGNTVVS